jgi:hypothetical protein
MNDEIRDLIISKAPPPRLKQAARESGVVFLRDVGNRKTAER